MQASQTPSPSGYTATAKVLHWMTAMLVLITIGLGLHMERVPGYKHGEPDWNSILFWHASIGALILWLTVGRLVWRITHRPPTASRPMPAWQGAAAAVHGIFYVLLLALPVAGYLHRAAGAHAVSFFGLFDWPVLTSPNEPLRLLTGNIHVGLALALIAFIGLHLAAVAKHVAVDRDNILSRMT